MAAETQKTSTDKSVQIVLIGKSGSGKSSSGNTILGKKLFSSTTSSESVTRKCQSEFEIINSRKVTVVDTPAWNCTQLSEDKTEAKIKQTLQKLHGPYSFLLVIRVSSVTSEDIQKIYSLQKVFGSSYLQHTTILFTHKDNLQDVQQSFEEYIQEGGEELQKLLRTCEYRCHCWNNRARRSDEDVEKILKDLKQTERKYHHSMESSQNERPMKPETPPEQKENALICAKKLKGNDDSLAVDTQESHDPDERIRVLFLGMAKMGKSSSIRTLLGKSEQVKNKELVYKCSLSGLNLELIDSPGFNENPEEVQKVISMFTSSKCKPHVIIIVMSVGRFSPAVKKTMQHVQHCLSQCATNTTMVLFTGKDDLQNKPIKTFIQENADLHKLVQLNGNRFHALNNRDAKDEAQVNELLVKIFNIYEENKRTSGEQRKEDKCTKNNTEEQSCGQRDLLSGLFVSVTKLFQRKMDK